MPPRQSKLNTADENWVDQAGSGLDRRRTFDTFAPARHIRQPLQPWNTGDVENKATRLGDAVMRGGLPQLKGLGLFLGAWLGLIGAVPSVASAQAVDSIVAIAVPLTGPHARTGAAMQTAAGIVAAEINATGGINGANLVLTMHDDPCTTPGGIERAKAIVASQVAAVIGHICASSARVAAPVYAAAQTLFIAVSRPAAGAGDRRAGPLSFRGPVPGVSQARFIGQFLAAVPGARIAIVRDKTQLMTSIATGIEAALRSASIQPVAVEVFSGGDKDFTGLAQRLVAAKITHVGLAAFAVEGGLIAADLVAALPNIEVVGPDMLATADFAQLAGSAAGRVRIALEADVDVYSATQPRARALVDRLADAGLAPTRAALATAAALEAWAFAARAAGTTTPAEVAQALTLPQPTILGTLAFDVQGEAALPFWAFYRWSDGTLAPDVN